jgi:hypothetical protein
MNKKEGGSVPRFVEGKSTFTGDHILGDGFAGGYPG